MKKTTRLLCTLLCMGMLLSAFAACSEKTPPQTAETTAAPGAESETRPAETQPAEADSSKRENAKDSLPDDLKLNGMQIHIHSFDNEKIDIIGDNEISGDVLHDAVYQRTRRVMERLDVDIIWADSKTAKWQDFSSELNTTILAGADEWQIVFAMGNATIQKNLDALFTDLSSAKYLDFSQPWWWQDAMEEVSFDSVERKFLVGDIALSNFTASGAYFFNKNLYTDTFGNADDLYKTVIDGKWTYDTLQQIAAQAYRDINGNGLVDEGDLYGLRFANAEFLKHAEYSTDIRHFRRDDQGFPVIDYDTQRAQEAVDAMYSLLYETQGVIYQAENLNRSIFPNRGTLFYARHLGEVLRNELRSMEDDYGILPYPKLDEQQADYRGLLHNSSNYVTVPITVLQVDEVSAVIEALCAESYRSVVEIFYDTALKTKYSRDAYSGQCIDIIRDTTRKSFLYEYNSRFGCGNVVADCIGAGNTNFASTYANSVNASNKKIEKAVIKFLDEKENN